MSTRSRRPICAWWISWQLTQVTSTFRCFATAQFSRWRDPAWQVRHTADFSVAVAVLDVSALSGLFFAGSFRCSDASPWQAWHMLPLASLLAPWGVKSIEFH